MGGHAAPDVEHAGGLLPLDDAIELGEDELVHEAGEPRDQLAVELDVAAFAAGGELGLDVAVEPGVVRREGLVDGTDDLVVEDAPPGSAGAPAGRRLLQQAVRRERAQQRLGERAVPAAPTRHVVGGRWVTQLLQQAGPQRRARGRHAQCRSCGAQGRHPSTGVAGAQCAKKGS